MFIYRLVGIISVLNLTCFLYPSDGYPLGSICNFENGLCGWRGLRSFWLRHSGPTQTRLTGPSVDHTQGTSDGESMFSLSHLSTIAMLLL